MFNHLPYGGVRSPLRRLPNHSLNRRVCAGGGEELQAGRGAVLPWLKGGDADEWFVAWRKKHLNKSNSLTGLSS
ncbi:hypothetical protein [Roseovarius sp.]|uniref:hypothetical protein n=1 Tax=Roseovarius sp. TaxID=1486281 RepID=UPI003D11A58F